MIYDTIRIACASQHALGQRIVELHRLYGDRVRSTYREPVQRWVGDRRCWVAQIQVAPTEERPADMAHISRIDSPARRSYGWLVRLQRGGERRVKWFGDRPHGGSDVALAAAQRWRDLAAAELARRHAEYEVPG